jgi:hypothetical protein
VTDPLIVYPSITDSRATVSANVDLTTKISSRFASSSAATSTTTAGPDPTATSTDYGIVTSLTSQWRYRPVAGLPAAEPISGTDGPVPLRR